MTPWLRRSLLKGGVGDLLALAAGALTPLFLAPYGLWPLALLSLALFYLLLKPVAAGRALWRGWCYGFSTFLLGTGWIYVSIHTYGHASPLLAGTLTVLFSVGVALFFALPAWLWTRWLRCNKKPLADALFFAALWLLLEWFRSWFLTGFPWLFVGYSQTDGPLAGLAPVGGVWLVSFVLALTAALLCNLPVLLLRRPRQAITALVLLAPWGVGIALTGHAWTTPKGSPLRVTLVQGNIDQNQKWNPETQQAQLDIYTGKTLASGPADLFVWPETAVPLIRQDLDGFLKALGQRIGDEGGALITGIPATEMVTGEEHDYNAVLVLGRGDGLYLKQRLVPFGEYVPLQDLLRGAIRFFDLPMSNFAAGPANQPPLLVQGIRLAPSICYEVVYPELVASLARNSDMLLTVSNDAWFGDSIGPVQHLQMARMRALESGRWMLRATNNGITALMNPQGKVVQEVPRFQVEVLQGQAQPMQGLTPYLRWGLWPVLVLSLVLSGIAVWSRFRGREVVNAL